MTDENYRLVGSKPKEKEPEKKGRNIVAVIGIDQYQHLSRLHNAVSDARGVREMFIDQLGFEELTQPLYDQTANADAITALIRDELPNLLKEDDSLVLFFAGHGYTEKRQSGDREVKTGYLVPFEGRHPDEGKFSSYLKLGSFLEDIANLPARHVLVILDACHSGFALGTAAHGWRDIESYTDDLSSRLSRRVITSAMEDQLALDTGPVADHSLFTGTLIEALQLGKADDTRKGFVTSSELGVYVQQNVATWSKSKQTPDFGSFEQDDRGELVISLEGETHNRQMAQECLQIANAGYELGWYTNEPRRFEFAVKQYREANKYASIGKLTLPDARLGLGKSLLTVGDFKAAEEELTLFTQSEEGKGNQEAIFFLGLAQAQNKQKDQAIDTLKSWLKENPEQAYTTWVEEYIHWLDKSLSETGERRYALLIGINAYQSTSLPKLRGCVNDVNRLIKPAIVQKLGFHERDIRVLTDKAATRKKVLEELNSLKAETSPGDDLLVFFSGHSLPTGEPLIPGRNDMQTYLLLQDSIQDGQDFVNGLSAGELHQYMMDIPAGQKTLILDTHASQVMVDLAASQFEYNLILASDTAEVTYENYIMIEGERLYCGLFSSGLYQSIINEPDSEAITYSELMESISRGMLEFSQANPNTRTQTPLFVGDRTQRVFGDFDPFWSMYQFSMRKNWPEYSVDNLKREYLRLKKQFERPFPALYEAFARAFQAKGLYSHACEVLSELIEQYPNLPPKYELALSFSQARLGNYQAAKKHLQSVYSDQFVDEVDSLERILSLMDALEGTRRKLYLFLCNLKSEKLVNTTDQIHLNITEVENGTITWLQRLKEQLYSIYGKDGLDVKVFPQEQSTADFILSEVASLDQQPTLMVILGFYETYGSGVSSVDRFFTQLKEFVDEKPVFIWLQRDPHEAFTR